MLALEDYLDALTWAEGLGGLKALIARSQDNLGVLDRWVRESGWADFLAREQATRSNTSVCLKIVDPWFKGLAEDAQADAAKKIATLLEKEGVAFDIGGYRSAPPGLRIWCGATVEKADLEALTPLARLGLGSGQEGLIHVRPGSHKPAVGKADGAARRLAGVFRHAARHYDGLFCAGDGLARAP